MPMEGMQPWCRRLDCPDIDSCSYGIENICKKYIEIIKTKQEVETSTVKHSDKNEAVLLCIQNECLQKKTYPRTVGHYVIDSGEMTRVKPNDEIHILTNEYANYDFTPMSSLTIAINTMKGVHYFYYGTKEQEETVDNLKEVIKDYYRKSFRARQKITCWIRHAKSSMFNYNEFLRTICGTTIRNVISRLINGCNIENKQEIINDLLNKIGDKSKQKTPDLASLETVLNWISGSSYTDEHSIYKFIDKVGLLIVGIKDNDILRSDSQINDFCKKIQLLLDMKEFTIWQTQNDYTIEKERIDYLLGTFQYKDHDAIKGFDNILIPEQVRQWLQPEENEIHCGETQYSEEEMSKWASNIHFGAIEDRTPYILCYSFSLFLCETGPAAAWYTTYEHSKNREKKAIDNDLFMVDFTLNDYVLLNKLEEAFKTMIASNQAALQMLKESRSRLIQHLKL